VKLVDLPTTGSNLYWVVVSRKVSNTLHQTLGQTERYVPQKDGTIEFRERFQVRLPPPARSLAPRLSTKGIVKERALSAASHYTLRPRREDLVVRWVSGTSYRLPLTADSPRVAER
jgi:hypothetical protein